MKNRIYNEQNSLWYELQGDYYIPCLALPNEEQVEIGVWGQRHSRYIKQHHKMRYTNLLTSGKLTDYLADIDEQAEDMFVRNSLVIESIKIIKQINPRFFIFENVPAFMKTICTDIDGEHILKKS